MHRIILLLSDSENKLFKIFESKIILFNLNFHLFFIDFISFEINIKNTPITPAGVTHVSPTIYSNRF